jgi:hypothetical protein
MAKLEKQSVTPPPGQIKHDEHKIGTLDQSSYDTKGTPSAADDEMYFGDGNLPTNYNISVDDKTHIELGLKIHYRQGNDITPTSVDADGTAHYKCAGRHAGRRSDARCHLGGPEPGGVEFRLLGEYRARRQHEDARQLRFPDHDHER